MNSRLPMALATAGLGAAALMALTAGPALADQRTSAGPAVSQASEPVPSAATDQELAYLLIRSTKLDGLKQAALLGKSIAIDVKIPRILNDFKKVEFNGQKLLDFLKTVDPKSPQDPAIATVLANPAYKAQLDKLKALPKHADLYKALKETVGA